MANIYDAASSAYARYSNDLRDKMTTAYTGDLPIHIWRGHSYSMWKKESRYPSGINILWSCHTDIIAQDLNKMVDQQAPVTKFFFGLNGTTHTYGDKIYKCGDKRLTEENIEYITEELKTQTKLITDKGGKSKFFPEYGMKSPLIRLILMFHKILRKRKGKEGRGCAMLTIERIAEVVQEVSLSGKSPSVRSAKFDKKSYNPNQDNDAQNPVLLYNTGFTHGSSDWWQRFENIISATEEEQRRYGSLQENLVLENLGGKRKKKKRKSRKKKRKTKKKKARQKSRRKKRYTVK